MDTNSIISEGCGTAGSAWYTRCKTPWKLASEEQIKSVTNYLETHQENQPIGEFKDVRFKQGIIYTVYCSGDTLVELLYDDTTENKRNSPMGLAQRRESAPASLLTVKSKYI